MRTCTYQMYTHARERAHTSSSSSSSFVKHLTILERRVQVRPVIRLHLYFTRFAGTHQPHQQTTLLSANKQQTPATGAAFSFRV